VIGLKVVHLMVLDKNIELAVKELSNLKNMNVIKDACAKINKLENKSDNVYNKAVF
jgi:hypothetical protein